MRSQSGLLTVITALIIKALTQFKACSGLNDFSDPPGIVNIRELNQYLV